LLEGGDSHLAAARMPATRDLMMIAHCLRIEHYEIAAYEITTRLAERLGLDLEGQALSELLAEEDRVINLLHELEPSIYSKAREV
jgi:ferritin-like metal-binding protein YciE